MILTCTAGLSKKRSLTLYNPVIIALVPFPSMLRCELGTAVHLPGSSTYLYFNEELKIEDETKNPKQSEGFLLIMLYTRSNTTRGLSQSRVTLP
jgi:hypothetical protein